MQVFPNRDNYGEWLGYKVESADREAQRTRVSLVIRAEHLSPAGKVHGGVVAGLFDFACGATVFITLGQGQVCSTVELKVNYLRPLVEGDVLEADTSVVFRGKRLCVLQSTLRRTQAPEPVAIATATFNIADARA
jgi:uncharacterized protein (TIGR00369 family)